MDSIRPALGDMPVVSRYCVVGAVVLGGLGGLIGLIVGLRVYAPTAWAAVFEVGIPSAVLGVLLGLLAGSIAHIRRRGRRVRNQ